MKKAFLSPKVAVINIATQDIICTSGGVTPQGGIKTGGSIPVLGPGTEVNKPIQIW